MKKLATILSMLAMTAVVGLSSCTTEDSPGGTTTGNGPTLVAANSASATAINVRWTRQTSDVTADTVVATANGVEASRVVVAAPGTTATLSGLTTGVQYLITVRSNAGSSAGITWMTAVRSGTIRLYETHDVTPGHLSGLYLGQTGGPAAVSSNNTDADIVFTGADNQSPSGMSLVAASITTLSGLSGGKDTRFSDSIKYIPSTSGDGLNNLYYTGNLTNVVTTGSDTANVIEIPVPGGAHSGNYMVFEVHTKTGAATGNYARVEIVPQSNGNAFGGTLGSRYVDLIVSYNPQPDQPYASRPHPQLISNQVRRPAH